MRNAFKILKPEVVIKQGRPMCKWQDSINIGFKRKSM
jgi:hypothetical protein